MRETRELRYREVLSIPLDNYELDALLKKLNLCKGQYPDETLTVSFDCRYIDEGPTEMNISYYSPETDEEYNERLVQECNQLKEKECKELNRLLQYKKLNASNQLRLEELKKKYLK